jgi:hypothetical protein
MPSPRLARAVVLAALLGVVVVMPQVAPAAVDVTVTVNPAAPAAPPAVQAPQAPSAPVRYPMTGVDTAATLTAALALLAVGLLLVKVHSTQRTVPPEASPYERKGS